MKYKYFLLFFVIFVFSFLVNTQKTVNAQFSQIPGLSFDVKFIPEIPGPNEDVYLEVISYETDINKAKITWLVNGSIKSSGTGNKTFTFNSGNQNTKTTISLRIITAEGVSASRDFNIRPSSVDIIWQARTYTPPFYKGKALFSHESIITFLALPHITDQNGNLLSPSNLIYTWNKNGKVLNNFSGYGKNTYSMEGSIISVPLEMTVTVTSPTTDAVGFARTIVYPVDPLVLMYEKDPLYGLRLEKSLSGIISLKNKEEMEVVALPIFFGDESLSSNSILYDWKINNSNIDTKTLERSKVFRPIEGTSGTSYISLSAENANKILQTASTGFNLEFNKETN
ncbi:MAG: hypothetical protein WC095_00915 [Candidatus Paceibacterota bacterium]